MYRLRFTVKGQNMVRAFIRSLFGGQRPLTVFRLIITVVLNAFNGMLYRRALTHISNNVGNILPSLTNSDSTPPITGVFMMSRIETTAHHSIPTAIGRMFVQSVFFVKRAYAVFVQASTTFCVPTRQFRLIDNYLLTARAITYPLAAALTVLAELCRCFTNGGQSMKRLSCQIYHNDVIIAHSGGFV